MLRMRDRARGIWVGLWSRRQLESEIAALEWCRGEVGEPQVEMEAERLPPIDHAFTHFDLRLLPIRVRCTQAPAVRERGDRLWYALDAPPRLGLPQPIPALFERLLRS